MLVLRSLFYRSLSLVPVFKLSTCTPPSSFSLEKKDYFHGQQRKKQRCPEKFPRVILHSRASPSRLSLSSISHISYCFQTPLFSSDADHGNYQRLEYRHIELSPRYSTSLPGDQNRTTNPTASQATVYQTPLFGPSSHSSPHASRGDSVDGFPLPPLHRAKPHTIPQQIPPRHPYTQSASVTAPPTSYGFRYNTASYGHPMPPYYAYTMQAPKIGAPTAFDFPGPYNVLSHGPSILPYYSYTQAPTTIGTPLPYNFLGCRDMVSHAPPIPPHYLYAQSSLKIGASLSHNFPGCHDTEVSRGSPGQCYAQVRCHSKSGSRRTHLLLLQFVTGTQSVQSFQPVQQVQPVQGLRGDPMDPTQPLHVAPLPFQGGETDASLKSKKYVCNYPCPAGCPTLFRRPQDLRRHLSTHLPHWVNCPDPDCSWRGDRLSVFRKHWDTNHPSSSQDLDEDKFITYDPWPFVEKIKDGSLSIEDAQQQAMAMVSKKASELRKPELSENPWGRKRRRKA